MANKVSTSRPPDLNPSLRIREKKHINKPRCLRLGLPARSHPAGILWKPGGSSPKDVWPGDFWEVGRRFRSFCVVFWSFGGFLVTFCWFFSNDVDWFSSDF